MSQLVPVTLFERGYADLISVIPPGAQLSPNSKITASQLGKVPGIRYQNRTWGGYDWRKHVPVLDDVRTWAQAGANVGLRSGRFPGIDIDSLNETVSTKVQDIAFTTLGPAPVRTGKPPKRLLMYRTAAPFARMRMWLEGESQQHLIEVLGEGQQYLVHGTHPGTMRPYSWDREPPPAGELTELSVDKVEAFFRAVRSHFEQLGFTVRREGDGRKHERVGASDQSSLWAPSLEALSLAVAAIPNTDDMFGTREQYIKMGAAIRAACGDKLEEGFDVWAEWCSRWASEQGKENDADTVRADWRRLYPPFALGWQWLAEIARGYGYSDAQDDFAADPSAAPPSSDQSDTPPPPRPRLSETWLAERVVEEVGDRLRFVPATSKWLAWSGSRWEPDGLLRAQAMLTDELRKLASKELQGVSTQGVGQAQRDAQRIESKYVLQAVMTIVRADPSIAVDVASLNSDAWKLNTPAGVIDLKTGALSPGLPEDLHTKSTRVAPMTQPTPQWDRFIEEATGGDKDLQLYLQRLIGYCLTGLTVEQILAFFWGEGGTGKSTFIHALREIMGDYATAAATETFTASSYDRHTTDLADLMGSRMVVASETRRGRKWDEQRLKLLSGGDIIKARFMRQDNFSFAPTFTLMFLSNYQPHIASLDSAMRRRIHMIPFTRKPATRDLFLPEKIRAEYPGILAWMIEGCLVWQREGLNPPEAVLQQTQQYFDDEDTLGRWMHERTKLNPDAKQGVGALYDSWREWCGEAGEKAGRKQDFVQELRAHGLAPQYDQRQRHHVVAGIEIDKTVDMPWEEPRS